MKNYISVPSAGSPSKNDLRSLLRPRSIAIVGASDRPEALGQRLLATLCDGRYRGSIYPVNPRYQSLRGGICYPDLTSLPERPDCVAFALPDDSLEPALSAAALLNIPAAVIFGRAYEAAGRGPSRPNRLADIARAANMAICGNNCMGFINFVDAIKMTGTPPPIGTDYGSVGLVSHSGSTWAALIGNQRDLLLNYAISSGQEIATTMGDYIKFLLDQPETRVIACVMEAVRDPKSFLEAVELAGERNIPVVVLKLGRSERGRSMALAHSGALSGSHDAYQAVFERHNVVSVRTPDELLDTVELFASPRRPSAPGIGIVTDSGGERELIVDLASDFEVPLADIGFQTTVRLGEILDPGMTPINPVDAWGDGRAMFRESLQALSEDAEVGVVVFAQNLVHGRPYLYRCTADIEATFHSTAKPVVAFGNVHSTISREEAARLRKLGVPVLMGTQPALLALKHFVEWQARRRRAQRRQVPNISPGNPVLVHSNDRHASSDRVISPETSMRMLEAFGIPVAASRFAETIETAVLSARELGFPVVLKTANPAIAHKTDSGGVVLGLCDEASLRAAYSRIARTCGPHMQVQAQVVEPGIEILLGMSNDPTFGPMTTVALGGVLTELLQDAVTIKPPVPAEDAAHALQRLKGYRLLGGYRGTDPVDLEALCKVVERFSHLCADLGSTFEAIDVNPVFAGPQGVIAVDALFVAKDRQGDEE